MELIALHVHPKNSNHLRSHLRDIMALDHSKLGLENKSGRIFLSRLPCDTLESVRLNIGFPVVRTDRWCTVTWLPHFLGWVDLLTYGAPLARALRAWSSAKSKMDIYRNGNSVVLAKSLFNFITVTCLSSLKKGVTLPCLICCLDMFSLPILIYLWN